MALKSNLPARIVLSRDQVLEDVKQIVGEIKGIPPDGIQETHELEADLGCDSLDLVEIFMESADHFAVDVPDEFAEQVRTVGDVADGVLRLLNKRGHH